MDSLKQRKIQIQKYLEKIKETILLASDLKSLKQEELMNYISTIKQLDQQFIKSIQAECIGHTLLTRHGKSSVFDQKRFGLYPNAPLDQNAIKNNLILSSVLQKRFRCEGFAYDQTPKQTALCLIPLQIKSRIKIVPELTQNSEYPSGMNILSKKEAKQELNKLSYFSSPICKVVYQASLWFYSSNQTYQQIQKLSNSIDEQLQKINTDPDEYFSEKNRLQTKFDKKDKIKEIINLIKMYGCKKQDLWLFGHSGLFTSFFHQIFDEGKSFQFCETRCIYAIKNKQKVQAFTPPYKFDVDQINGKISIKFYPNWLKFKDLDEL